MNFKVGEGFAVGEIIKVLINIQYPVYFLKVNAISKHLISIS